MLSDKNHKSLTKLLESKKAKGLRAKLKRQDSEIKRLLRKIKYMEKER